MARALGPVASRMRTQGHTLPNHLLPYQTKLKNLIGGLASDGPGAPEGPRTLRHVPVIRAVLVPAKVVAIGPISDPLSLFDLRVGRCFLPGSRQLLFLGVSGPETPRA